MDVRVANVEEVQSRLEPDEVMISYNIADEEVISFVITKDDFTFQKTASEIPVGDLVNKVSGNLKIMNAPEYCYKNYVEFQESAFALYQLLIKPIEDRISGKKLIVIPDEELGFLSFEMLIEATVFDDSVSFSKLPFLIRKYPFAYAGSATLFIRNRERAEPVLAKGVLAMAPVYSDMGSSSRSTRQRDGNKVFRRRELEGALSEASIVHRLVGGKKFLAEKATRENFLKYAGKYDILHLALHTRIDNKNPLSSQMSFYPFADTSNKGIVKAYELTHLDLKSQLAVLSACSTGGGKLEKGEGIISMARAFFQAGLPSVIMTLWDVEDQASRAITARFYHYLTSGLPKDEALRQAKLDYLDHTEVAIENHPAFWAGYVLYGDSKPFRINTPSILMTRIPFIALVAALTLFFILLVVYLHKKRIS
jgi:CHAT domain-containing protein